MNKAKLLKSIMPVVLSAVAALALPENTNATVPIDISTAPPPVAGETALKVRETTVKPVTGDPKIRLRCKTTRTGDFDPIVFPREIRAGHLHTFFGNDSIGYDSTSDSINNKGGSTCTGGIADRSAYWIPSVYDKRTGKVKTPTQLIVYYATLRDPIIRESLQPVPKGLKMIAGDHTNTDPTGPFQAANRTGFSCSSPTSGTYGSGRTYNDGKTIPACHTGSDMRIRLSFPNCWNGKDLDSADHKSHMAYSRTGNWKKGTNECPTTHPVRIPSIAFLALYKINVDNESKYWRLSSDMYDSTQPGGLSMHGDLMSGWNTKIMKMVGKNCLKAGKDCGMGLLGADINGKFWKLYYDRFWALP